MHVCGMWVAFSTAVWIEAVLIQTAYPFNFIPVQRQYYFQSGSQLQHSTLTFVVVLIPYSFTSQIILIKCIIIIPKFNMYPLSIYMLWTWELLILSGCLLHSESLVWVSLDEFVEWMKLLSALDPKIHAPLLNSYRKKFFFIYVYDL